MGPFNLNKKSKSILDCFTYDLSSFFFDEYEEIDSEETPATIMIVYEKKLPWSELGVFDAVQFRIFFDKENLTGSNPINVKFISREHKRDAAQLQMIVDKIISIYGEDDYHRTNWDEEDDRAFTNEVYRRVWTIEKGESFVSVESNQTDGMTLNILFFNNLLKETDNLLEAKY
ncbi:MAG TPA: hypothetical protein DCQ26_07645 [Marinilabiliales bacterium]|nr:hypothetical protein [Salinivirgaceae bacterium]OFX39162.1 MAG: hypothetical protein A2W95_00675 [Bacteroidetes bacterium GWA2_40_14]OFX64532.1 MAG: hypothetical protein A2W84_01390 [Bacteroidetes bacterium GWC2_40_13]OFX71906.1 MAG: hypothetical protein A2W96_06650 [Bacteroidetes bacterium GWD2_40_43]OFX94703.1 MAG: hypothetical protein A2W97_18455 [Bacteroidetes bacterium GWE2_40_63]OFY24768.1 MAG: hypothetical protein A2W88_16860 [Bacteroidetes bacterium GWF2_40_13]OFZ24468.1 MAG: hypot